MDAWVLNLDAEREMAHPRGYTPSRRVAASVARALGALHGLLAPGAVVLRPGEPPPPEARGARGRAWCPTPSAIRALRSAGALPEPAPPFEVIRRVNGRAFCASLGQGLSGARLVHTMEEALATLEGESPSGTWLGKRAFSFAGRGRRKLTCGPPAEEETRWLEASLREGPLQLEPWVEVETELALHGRLGPEGALELGEPCVQQVDTHGAFCGARRAHVAELPAVTAAALRSEAVRVAEALARQGYFGPFGVDAFLYRQAGRSRLLARSEINARYTMAWAVGMGHPA